MKGKLSYLLFLFLLSCSEEKIEAPLSEINIADIENIYAPENVSIIMQKVCDWQINNPISNNNGNGMAWARSTFYIGIMATYYTTHKDKYLEQAIKWAVIKRWKLDKRYDMADDHVSGQIYLELFLLKNDQNRIRSAQQTFDKLISESWSGRELYWWADALFMSPPVAARLHAATHDNKYLDFLHSMWWDVHDYLYDQENHLFYRDKWHFNDRTTPNKKKVFWSRGNGWVMAGTIRVLEYLPKEDPFYQHYINLHKEMASAVIKLQQEDGLWRPSLLDPEHMPYPETSGTAFFTYALAWGVNNGHLDRETYLPVIKKAWEALVEAIHPSGKLGWVQPGGSKPDPVKYDDYQEFGAGAFLLAGSEVYKLGLKN